MGKITLIILTPQVIWTLKMTFRTRKNPKTLGTMQIILACSILFTFIYGHYLLSSSWDHQSAFEALWVQPNGKRVHLFLIIFNKLTPLVPQQVERLAHHGKLSVTKMSPSSSWPIQNFDCWIVLPLKAQLARVLFLFPFREILIIYTPAVSLAQHIFLAYIFSLLLKFSQLL